MRVAIAGGGIAGLTSAIALARRGFPVDLYERAPVLEEIGAGIQLSPNAMAVLERIGVTDALAGRLFEPEALVIRDAFSGSALARMPLGRMARERYGAPYCTLHRADLQAALVATAAREPSITVNLGAELRDVAGMSAGVRFVAGEHEREADLLIAADGVHSAVRIACLGGSRPTALGRVAWRALLPMSEAGDLPSRQDVGLWLGPGCHLVHYPVEGGARINIVVVGGDDADLPLARFGKVARRVLEGVPEWVQSTLWQNDARLPWARGRIALIGDAAHAMAPSAAQGAAQAIEDAYVLAEALAAEKRVEEALQSFTSARQPRVQRIMRAAMQNLRTYEASGIPAALRNSVLRVLPATLILSRLDWLFGWKPQ